MSTRKTVKDKDAAVESEAKKTAAAKAKADTKAKETEAAETAETDTAEKAEADMAKKPEAELKGKAKAEPEETARRIWEPWKKDAIAPDERVAYCGPSVFNVVKQYTVYQGGIPDLLRNYLNLNHLAWKFLVPVDEMAEMKTKIETAGTAEAILFNKIKSGR